MLTAIFVHGITAYGFDGGDSCNTKASRKGRAQLLSNIPCDLSVQSYCNLPGTQYPWHAVRRFVHENQGLMKRMYGDIKHISVLKSEINNNDIEFDDVEKAASRYSKSGWKKNKYLYNDFSNSKNNDVLVEPYFRPASTTTKSTPSTVASTNPTTTPSRTSSNTVTMSSTMAPTTNTVTQKQSNEHFENLTTTATPLMLLSNIHIVSPPNLAMANKTLASVVPISSTLRIFPPPIISVASITPPQEDEFTTPSSTTESFLDITEQVTSSDEEVGKIQNNEDQVESSTTKYIEDIQQIIDSAEPTSNINAKQANKNIHPVAAAVTATVEHTEGQLFQDAVSKETPVYNTRGV